MQVLEPTFLDEYFIEVSPGKRALCAQVEWEWQSEEREQRVSFQSEKGVRIGTNSG